MGLAYNPNRELKEPERNKLHIGLYYFQIPESLHSESQGLGMKPGVETQAVEPPKPQRQPKVRVGQVCRI